MSFPTTPTPPPPPPFPPATGFAPEEPAGLTETQRLINVFVAPKKTFADLKRKSNWWVPWAISSVFVLIFGIIAVQKLDMGRFIQQQIDRSPAAQKRMEQATPEQRAQGMAIQATITKVTFYITPIFLLIGGLLTGAVLMAIFNFILGAEVPFQSALAVAFYAGLPGILGSILLIVSFLVSADPSTIDIAGNPMPTNPGFFMDPQGNKILYGLASALDIFKIWWVILLGLGFATASSNRKPSVGTALVTVFITYGIVVLIGISLKMAF